MSTAAKGLTKRCEAYSNFYKSGGNDVKVTPVPIPNTKVKLHSADGTAGETLWESRSLPGKYERILSLCLVSFLFAKASNIPTTNRSAKLYSNHGATREALWASRSLPRRSFIMWKKAVV